MSGLEDLYGLRWFWLLLFVPTMSACGSIAGDIVKKIGADSERHNLNVYCDQQCKDLKDQAFENCHRLCQSLEQGRYEKQRRELMEKDFAEGRGKAVRQ